MVCFLTSIFFYGFITSHGRKGLFTVSDRDSDLLWVQRRLIGPFTVSDCVRDSDIAFAKS